jgi:hypothetical protein
MALRRSPLAALIGWVRTLVAPRGIVSMPLPRAYPALVHLPRTHPPGRASGALRSERRPYEVGE